MRGCRIVIAGGCALLIAAVIALAYDSEWPPQPDPSASGMPPGPGLAMGEIALAMPAEFSPWLAHLHTQCPDTWGEWPVRYAFGDVEGTDDGDLDLVFCLADELTAAFRVEIDWEGKTGALVPLWVWKAPSQDCTPPTTHCGPPARNILVWDFDGDGRSEVAFNGPKWNGHDWVDALYFLQEDPNPGASECGFSVPPPAELASSYATWTDVGERVGLCRVRDTGVPRDVVTHSHGGNQLTIWSLVFDGSAYSVERLYKMDPSLTQNLGAKVHEFNNADIDGDGYDEFFRDGVLDFVDRVGGVATPTNGEYGVQLWRTGMTGISENHMDQMIAADFVPSRPGLEIDSVPSEPWTDWTGQSRAPVDTLWGADGQVLAENSDAPAGHDQSIYAGNWTATREGLESIYIPKGAGSQPAGEVFLAGGFAVDAAQNELVFDGASFIVVDPIPRRATGPAFRMEAIDWDGDYMSDEILDYCWSTLIVWRMGEKGDWLPGPPPPGMPDESEVLLPFQENGQDYWIYWYQGDGGSMASEWGWNNGGAGRFTHYYEKLGETYPGHGLYTMKGFDVGGDYREEATALTPIALEIFTNPDPAPNPILHRSPRESIEYRRFRQEMVTTPFPYADLPVLERIEVTPRTLGIPVGGSGSLTATAYYSDGIALDVTDRVSWWSEFPTLVETDGGGGVTSVGGTPGSARIFAGCGGGAEGPTFTSEPAYVYAGDSPRPAVLTAGFKDTFLIEGDLTKPLEIEARVASRDNVPLVVWVNDAEGHPWYLPGVTPTGYVFLADDGSPASGDDEAGDGVYSAVVPFAAHPDILPPGDTILQIQAMPLGIPASVESARSEPWPLLALGASSEMPGLTGDTRNDLHPGARMPRIRSCGFRGIDFPGVAVLEARVIPPSDPAVTVAGCLYTLPDAAQSGIGARTAPVWMTPAGGDTYLALIDTSGLPPGRHIVEVVAVGFDADTGETIPSDTWPRVRVHRR